MRYVIIIYYVKVYHEMYSKWRHHAQIGKTEQTEDLLSINFDLNVIK